MPIDDPKARHPRGYHDEILDLAERRISADQITIETNIDPAVDRRFALDPTAYNEGGSTRFIEYGAIERTPPPHWVARRSISEIAIGPRRGNRR